MQDVFQRVLGELRTKMTDFNYKNWFQNLSCEFEGENKVLLKVPSKFARDWIQTNYLDLIKFELFKELQQEVELSFKIDKKVTSNLELFSNPAQPQPVAKASEPVKILNRTPLDEGFSQHYTFQNFVVGNANQLAHAASQAVANAPGKSYNPLFIYGGVGLGKTHLMNAIGYFIRQRNPNWRVLYVTGESFTNEVIQAIRFNKTQELRKKYRDCCDVLLMDDVQFIAGKERTMEEFFHTFNTLFDARKQIILSSDVLPKDMHGLDQRLVSRFSFGLLADIQKPDYETRLAILMNKAAREGFVLPNDVADYMASQITTNVRELEGALVRVFAFSSLTKIKVTLDLAKEVLQKIITPTKQGLSVERIQEVVSDYFELKISDLKSKRRHQNMALPRQMAMYLCKVHLSVSFPEIGHKFGGKDHTTVMHAVQKIKKCLESGPEKIKEDVLALEKCLGI